MAPVSHRTIAAAAATLWLALCAAVATSAGAQSDEPLAAGPGAGWQGFAAPLPAGVRKLADVPYGSAGRQRIDVYLPPPGTAPASGAPILVMVHGGAWIFGNKNSPGVVGEKLAHWTAHGWILVSVDNRLWPEADPLTQSRDVAAALGLVQKEATSWGGDAKRLILMGHSAGAHLVALLSASPTLAAQSGAAPWAGTVVLDSAAIDLTTLMQHRHARFYDRVFGADPVAWHDASPTDRLEAGATPMLLVCSTLRADDSCAQTQRFADRAAALRLEAAVHKEALSHLEVNASLGRPGPYTQVVDAFIASVLNAPH
jgi:acetyl esterase/lipase